MFVIVDIGNSITKVASFEGDHLSKLIKLKDQEVITHLEKFNSCKGLISSVRNGELTQKIQKICKSFLSLEESVKLPIQLNYRTLKTLGKDRIANAVGAHSLYPYMNNLVIDLGTCITYDFIDSRGVFHGGAISPGMGLRYKSLNQYTASLPLVNPTGSTPKLIGKSTEKSIQSGVENGILFEVKETINQYKIIYKELNVLITGGDRLLIKSIAEYEKNGIFAVENLTLIGLNQILKENVKV